MSKLVDRTGQRYGRLVVLYRGPDKVYLNGRKAVTWVCQCDCGQITTVQTTSLQSGATKSCGCWNKEQQCSSDTKHKKHGERNTRLYGIWQGMKKRCYNKTSDNYYNYGGRGIEMCAEWRYDYVKFADWAKEHGYQENLTLDRIDPNGNYTPENCRWATNKQQQRNKNDNRIITFNNESYTLAEWAEKTGINRSTISSRIDKLGWTIETALTTPPKR